MPFETRPLCDADAYASDTLRHEAFGASKPQGSPTLPPGTSWLGTFDGDTLAARLGGRDYESWFGGARIDTAGVSGVTVAPEYRGRGLLTPLFCQGIAEARERGAVISTLFPTAAAIYRRFGYEVISDLITVRVPTSALAPLSVPDGLSLRRATPADAEAVRRCYARWASQQNGPLTRDGALFPATDEQLVGAFSGLTLAERDGQVHGFVSWDRSQGYGDHAHVFVHDLVADDLDAGQGLLAMLGSFAAVTGEVRIQTSGFDGARLLVPTIHWDISARSPYMLRVLDVPGALRGRRWPAIDVEVEFGVVCDDPIGGIDGFWNLTVEGGSATVSGGIGRGPTLTSAGLALLYAGATTCSNLRRIGQLSGPDRHDLVLDALFAGYQPHIRDYF